MTAYLERLGSRRAVLMRRRRADIDDVSCSGCRLRTTEPLEPGAVGVLAVQLDGQIHTEFFRVARTVVDHGGYHAGVEFLPVPADSPSLRDLAEHLDQNS